MRVGIDDARNYHATAQVGALHIIGYEVRSAGAVTYVDELAILDYKCFCPGLGFVHRIDPPVRQSPIGARGCSGLFLAAANQKTKRTRQTY
jgi:hypothetical protein